jgi:uncharacterized membrane protein
VEWSFGDVIWAMIAFYFWFLFIWAFIKIFADIFRREDVSGWAKAGWVLLIVVLPLLGILIYLIARPRMTDQHRQLRTEAEEVTGIAGQITNPGMSRKRDRE